MSTSDYIDMLKAAAKKAAQPIRIGITAAVAVSETRINDKLFADYASHDQAEVNISAFRIEALLLSARKQEFTPNNLTTLLRVLRSRIDDLSAPVCSSDIVVGFCCASTKDEQTSILTDLM